MKRENDKKLLSKIVKKVRDDEQNNPLADMTEDASRELLENVKKKRKKKKEPVTQSTFKKPSY
jgi:hypothetical protein